jgi:hypothetical protein
VNLPGWKCGTCHAFCGEAKERLAVCRACGAPRPAELDGLETVLKRDDLTSGERVVFMDMQRAIEAYGVTLTEGQIGWIATVQKRPVRRKSVQEAAIELEIGPHGVEKAERFLKHFWVLVLLWVAILAVGWALFRH